MTKEELRIKQVKTFIKAIQSSVKQGNNKRSNLMALAKKYHIAVNLAYHYKKSFNINDKVTDEIISKLISDDRARRNKRRKAKKEKAISNVNNLKAELIKCKKIIQEKDDSLRKEFIKNASLSRDLYVAKDKYKEIQRDNIDLIDKIDGLNGIISVRNVTIKDIKLKYKSANYNIESMTERYEQMRIAIKEYNAKSWLDKIFTFKIVI